MKALLLWDDQLIRVIEVEERRPEIIIPIHKRFDRIVFEDPQLPLGETSFMTMVFRYADGGRGKYLVYELEGFDS